MARRWSEAEEALLRELVAADTPVARMATKLNRTGNSVLTRMRDLGLKLRVERTDCGDWTTEQIATVRALLTQGKGRAEIAEAMGLLPDNVREACVRNGLADAYMRAMQLRRGRPNGSEAERVPNNAADEKACRAFARALVKAGGFARQPELPPLSFEEKLALVRAGKLRIVERAPLVKPLAYVPSQHGGCVS